MQVGFSKIEITPPVGTDLTGFILRQQPSVGAHDPLYARIMYLQDDRQRVFLLVAVDTLGFNLSDHAALCEALKKACQLPADHIFIAASHTHGGPACMRLLGCGEISRDWFENFLPKQLVIGAERARQTMKPCEMMKIAPQFQWASNRRVAWESTDSVGTIDPEITTVLFRDRQTQQLLGLVYNYACHPYVSGISRYFTADFPGVSSRELEKAFPGSVALFLNGAAADLHPVHRTGDAFANMEIFGKELSNTILKEIRSAKPHWRSGGPITVATREVTIGYADWPSREKLKDLVQKQIEAEKNTAALSKQGGSDESVKNLTSTTTAVDARWAKFLLSDKDYQKQIKEFPVSLRGVRVDDWVIVGFPGEVFVENGLQVKAQWAPSTVSFAGYSNGNIGYLVPASAVPQGGYEVTGAYVYYGYPSRFSAESVESLIEGAKLLKQDLERK